MELNPSRKLLHRPSDHRDKNNETHLKTAQPIQLPETDTRLKVAQPIQRMTPRHTHPATTETRKTKRIWAQRTPPNDQKPIQYQHAAHSIHATTQQPTHSETTDVHGKPSQRPRADALSTCSPIQPKGPPTTHSPSDHQIKRSGRQLDRARPTETRKNQFHPPNNQRK